jgi:hypothetical protein
MKLIIKELSMKRWIIGLLIGVGAAGMGVGSAFAYNAIVPADQTAMGFTNGQIQNQRFGMMAGRQGQGQDQQFGLQQGQNQTQPFGMMPGWQRQQQGQGTPSGQPGQPGQIGQMPGGMMNGLRGNGWNSQSNGSTSASTERISMEDATTKAQAYVSTLGSNLEISEIMEFQNNFYVVVIETDSRRGAMELIVNPYTGNVSREQGADMMWNLKYGGMGMMASQTATDSTLTLEEARSAAQQALETGSSTEVLNEDGTSFYGYYTFDYSIDGQTAGMLSINGLTGQVLYHNWHGTFISEKEY